MCHLKIDPRIRLLIRHILLLDALYGLMIVCPRASLRIIHRRVKHLKGVCRRRVHGRRYFFKIKRYGALA